VRQEEIEPAPAHLAFRSSNPGAFEARNPILFDQVAGHIIRPVGMEHDRVSAPFNGDRGVSGLARRAVILPDHVDGSAWKEKLLQSARIRKIDPDGAALEFAADQEPIRPVQEGGHLRVQEDA
jgi:hypothetical protein